MRPNANTEREQMRLRSLTSALGLAQVAVLHQGLDLTYDLAENLPETWPVTDLVGRTDVECLPPTIAPRIVAARTTALSERRAVTVQVELRRELVRHVFEFRIAPDTDGDGVIRGLITTMIDVTDRRERELATESLLREVSHRSKNLLAIVQSVAMQTARYNTGIADFLEKFRGRLHALSTTQDLVTESNWRGTRFQSLALAQLSRVGQRALEQVKVSGDNPLLRPNAALHIGLAVHELAANAQLYGHEDSIVELQVKLETNGEEPAFLTLDWVETGKHLIDASPTAHFGTMVLERIVPLSVGGTASFGIDQDAVRYRLIVPASEFEA